MISASTGGAQCPAVQSVGGEALRCHLEEDHPELHWDRALSVVWAEWTTAQELEENPDGDYHVPWPTAPGQGE
jgi:hypothetical protein